ncbi:MAG TPA: enoyl-CoA hydratase-related protein [Acidimicrobiales bacterium]|nr:enoyl-CoA hydratase-related protein [Acidimicrobiales bacterium]
MPDRLSDSGDAGSGADHEVLYDVAGAVATLTINRPERRNAMSWSVIRSLRAGVSRAGADPAVRVLVLTGAGDKAFCSGADLSAMSGGHEGFLSTHQGRGELAGLFAELWELGKPTIARVQGWAMAGGFGLALACDLVVASDQARFGAPEIDVGLWPYMITVPLARSMPPKKALELMLTGRVVGAEEGERLGFVNKVVPHAQLDEAVDELAAALAAKSPTAMKLGRGAFYAVWDMAAADALAYLHVMLSITAQTEDAAEGTTAFLEKRPARWTGR